MHEDIIRQRFEEWYRSVWGSSPIDADSYDLFVAWKAAYASMREIEEQPDTPDKAVMEEMEKLKREPHWDCDPSGTYADHYTTGWNDAIDAILSKYRIAAPAAPGNGVDIKSKLPATLNIAYDETTISEDGRVRHHRLWILDEALPGTVVYRLDQPAPAPDSGKELEKVLEAAINAFDQINEKTPWSETEPQWWLSMIEVQRQLKSVVSKKRKVKTDV